MIYHDTPRYIMICHDISWYIMIYHDALRYIMIYHDISWYIIIMLGVDAWESILNSSWRTRCGSTPLDHDDIMNARCASVGATPAAAAAAGKGAS